MASKQRKVFDSGKQRATGSDIPIQSVKKVQQEIKQVRVQVSLSMPNCRSDVSKETCFKIVRTYKYLL